MTDEPAPIKRRGRGYVCIVCNKKHAGVDAFCSTSCCRAYFGTELPRPTPGIPVGASA